MLQLHGQFKDGTVQKIPFESFTFPGGEQGLRIDTTALKDADGHFTIEAALRSSSDILSLLMLTDALRQTLPAVEISLRMPYVPYARQDRVCRDGESLSIRVFAQLINTLNFRTVTVLDPHSAVTPALINNVIVTSAQNHVAKAVAAMGGDVVLVAPDMGASSRVRDIARALGLQMLQAQKTRDASSGVVTGVQVLGVVPPIPLLVVDDICDGGRTFIELALAVRRIAPQQTMGLYVSHGIFSKGLEVLSPLYRHIFTANSWLDSSTPGLTVV
ncbi:MAG: ribose-phosphate pyrophosphokinase [Polaromonas sp.]|nr:MAG: ribose-phosphate pyrophosphokinase [Polaromonas sp.]